VEAPSASVAMMSSMNGPTYGPSPKSQGIVPENDHDPLASVVAKLGTSAQASAVVSQVSGRLELRARGTLLDF